MTRAAEVRARFQVDPVVVALLAVQRLAPMATLVAYTRGVGTLQLVALGAALWGISTVLALRVQAAGQNALVRGISDAAWGIARRTAATIRGGAHDQLLALIWRGVSARGDLSKDKNPTIASSVVALPVAFALATIVFGVPVAAVILAAAAVGIVVRVPMTRPYARLIEESNARWSVLAGDIGHALRALEDLQAHGLQDTFARALERDAVELSRAETRVAKARVLAVWVPLAAGGTAFALGIVAVRGTAVTLLDGAALAALAPIVVSLARALIARKRLVADAAALDALARLPPDLAPHRASRALPASLTPIAWEKISFRYPPPFSAGSKTADAPSEASPPAQGAKLVFDDVTVRWSGDRPLALIGANGSGKSTLLALVLRLVDPERGLVRLGGEDIRELDPEPLRERIAYVPQRPLLLEGMTVAEAMRLTAPRATDDALLAALERVGLGGELHARAGSPLAVRCASLSAGQAQRVAVARALARGARVFVLDEPEAALDPVARVALRRLLEELAASGHLVILATQHDEVVPAGAARLELPLAPGAHVEI